MINHILEASQPRPCFNVDGFIVRTFLARWLSSATFIRTMIYLNVMERAATKILGIGKVCSALKTSEYAVVSIKSDNKETIAPTLNKNTAIPSNPCFDIYKGKASRADMVITGAPGFIKLNTAGRTRKSVNIRTGSALFNKIIAFTLEAAAIRITSDRSNIIDNALLRRAAVSMNNS